MGGALSIFGSALLLAMIGVYGVISRRALAQELGIRIGRLKTTSSCSY